MSAFRFAHLADAHVGAWPKDAGLRARLRESVLKALQTVEDERCEFLVIAGDFFDKAYPDPSEVVPVVQALRQLQSHGIRIYSVYGSHDFVLHQTSWLDVLAESGLFVRIAPTTVVVEGERWPLPWVRDARTGAVLGGISGRAQGLDRKVYDSADPSDFLSQAGFRIFVYHAGIAEYLPKGLAGKIECVAVDSLPAGCGYYAGGHIHTTYSGPGPGGQGILVNPGAVFGTSSTDLEAIHSGRTKAGVVIVEVQDGVATPRWVIATPRDVTAVVDVDASDCDQTELMERFRKALPKEVPPGTLVIPRIKGTTSHPLDLTAFSAEAKRSGAGPVHLDVQDLHVSASPVPEPSPRSPDDIEGDVLSTMLEDVGVPELRGDAGVRAAVELLRALGIPKADGESKEDYRQRMLRQGLKVLRAKPKGEDVP